MSTKSKDTKPSPGWPPPITLYSPEAMKSAIATMQRYVAAAARNERRIKLEQLNVEETLFDIVDI